MQRSKNKCIKEGNAAAKGERAHNTGKRTPPNIYFAEFVEVLWYFRKFRAFPKSPLSQKGVPSADGGGYTFHVTENIPRHFVTPPFAKGGFTA